MTRMRDSQQCAPLATLPVCLEGFYTSINGAKRSKICGETPTFFNVVPKLRWLWK